MSEFRDNYGNRIVIRRGDWIFDTYGNRLYEIRGDWIHDTHGNRLGQKYY